MSRSLLWLDNLRLSFCTSEAQIEALRGINLSLGAGERLGIVGESGSGKSQLCFATLGLLPDNAQVSGRVCFDGIDLLTADAQTVQRLRGNQLAMIFQDPMSALNPYLTVGRQLTEVLRWHERLSRRAAQARAVDLLERVRLPEASIRMRAYPHELSGGMRQRVMIAMALLCEPRLLIADEPTTALDVTVQTDIMALLQTASERRALMLISHDLHLAAGVCQRIVVMYAGLFVEIGSVEDLFTRPAHPYTRGLLRAVPGHQGPAREPLYSIPGQPPQPDQIPQGCAFAPRCEQAFSRCHHELPPLHEIRAGHWRACHLDAAL